MEIYENLSLENLDGETWKEISDYGGDYFISNFGRVKSFKKYHGVDVRILKPNKNNNGYFYFRLYKNKREKTKQIHTLMYENHIEKIPEGYVIHHIDGNEANNILENFQMMTDEEHKKLHMENISEETRQLMSEKKKGEANTNYGKDFSGENGPNSVLKEQDVIEIRIDLKEGLLTQKEIGEKFGVSHHTISDIKRRKTWKHIM